jgi:hypothetical protein
MVGSVDRRVHHHRPVVHPGGVRLGQKPEMDLAPRSVGRVSAVPLPNRLPRTELRGKVLLGSAAPVLVNDAFNDLAIAPKRASTPPVRTRQQPLDPGSLIITQNRCSRHPSSIPASQPRFRRHILGPLAYSMCRLTKSFPSSRQTAMPRLRRCSTDIPRVGGPSPPGLDLAMRNHACEDRRCVAG